MMQFNKFNSQNTVIPKLLDDVIAKIWHPANLKQSPTTENWCWGYLLSHVFILRRLPRPDKSGLAMTFRNGLNSFETTSLTVIF